MKRRLAAVVLCVLLALQTALPPVQAAERVYFTAVGNYVLPLSDGTMPIWSGGYLYITSSLFSGTGREILGISQVLNTAQERLVLYSGGRSLTFDLNQSFARDNDGQLYYPGAVRRGGGVFVPADAVTRCFDLTYSIIEVPRGSLVWLRVPDPGYSLSESLFADAAQYSMESRYAEYLRDRERAEGAAQAPSDKPSSPSSTPTPPPAQEEEAELNGKQVYLCMEGVSSALLDVLNGRGARAAFFLTPEEMLASGPLLRRMMAEGQSVGILVDGSDPERSVEEQLEAGNRALYQATCGKTRLAYVRNGSQAAAEALGFRCLRPDLDRSGAPLLSASGAEGLLQRVSARRGNVRVWLGSETSAAGLRSFVAAAQEAGGVCAGLRETSR